MDNRLNDNINTETLLSIYKQAILGDLKAVYTLKNIAVNNAAAKQFIRAYELNMNFNPKIHRRHMSF